MLAGMAVDIPAVTMGRDAAPSRPPASVSTPATVAAVLAGLAVGTAIVFGLRPTGDPEAAALMLMLLVALPVAVVEFRREWRGRDRSVAGRPLDPARLTAKLVGLWAVFAALVAGYLALPIYREPFYAPFRSLVAVGLGPLLLASIPYVLAVDRLQADPDDRLHALGRRLLGRGRPGDGAVNHALGWVVKGYFFPLMYCYLCGQTGDLLSFDPAAFERPAEAAYVLAYDAIFLVDLVIASIGYVMTFRLLGTEIRSTEPTVGGWLVALACYMPFWTILYDNYLTYDPDWGWGTWLWDRPVLYAAWAVMILACLSVYVWATVCFGIRFSNLTHRGIITSGPYRWTRHPAYLSKNISWWLVAIPFWPEDGSPATAFRHCLLLAGVNAIYYLRARTEERHLMTDPVYAAYDAYIREHGVIARLRRRLPRRRAS